MADGLTLNAGSGGATLATDDIAGTHYQIVKVAFGALDTATLVSTTDPLPISDAGGSLTVDGTVAATQSGAWNVTNISGTVSLPTGAATAAKQPALGTAGTPSSDVLTVQGITSMTALKVDGSAVTQPVSGTVTANAGTGTFTVSGTVTANAGTGTMAVSNAGTFAVQAAQSGTWNVGTVTTVSAVTAISNALPAGTNNIGDVDVLTQPARAATTDTITAKLATDAIQNGTTALTPKFAAISASTSGDNTVVAAVTSKKIRVLNYTLMANGTVNAKWKTGTLTDLTGLLYLVANTGATPAFSPVGQFETAAGEALTLNLSAAIAVGGHLAYVEV